MAVALDHTTFESEVLQSGDNVIVDFWAPWCAPCKQMNPVIDKLEKEYNGKIKFCKVDVSEQAGLAQNFSIMSIPALFYFEGGVFKDQIVGYADEDKIKDKFEI